MERDEILSNLWSLRAGLSVISKNKTDIDNDRFEMKSKRESINGHKENLEVLRNTSDEIPNQLKKEIEEEKRRIYHYSCRQG